MGAAHQQQLLQVAQTDKVGVDQGKVEGEGVEVVEEAKAPPQREHGEAEHQDEDQGLAAQQGDQQAGEPDCEDQGRQGDEYREEQIGLPGEDRGREEAVVDAHPDQHQQVQPGEYRQRAQDLAQHVVDIGERAHEHHLDRVLLPVPLDEFGGQQGREEALVHVQQLETGQRQGTGERPEEVGGVADLGADAEIEEEQEEEPQGREEAEGPRAPHQAGFAPGDGPDRVEIDHAGRISRHPLLPDSCPGQWTA